MLDLEDRIRAEVTRQSEAYEPPADLPGRITARVTGRRNARRLAVAGMAAAVLVVAGVAAGLVASAGPDRTDTAPATTPATTRPAPATTAPAPTTTGPTTPTAPPPEEGTDTTSAPPATTATTTTLSPAPTTSGVPPAPIGSDTPLSRAGVGRIFAGDVLGAAAERQQVVITPGEPIGPTSTCITARVAGTAFVLLAEVSGDPADDPMTGTILQVRGGTSTVEGVRIGDSMDRVHEVYGPPTDSLVAYNNTYEMFGEDGFAYVVTFNADGFVSELASGGLEFYPEGCA